MSASQKKKAKPEKKRVSARKKAKVTRTKKVAKRTVAEKPKKAAPKEKKVSVKKEKAQKEYVKPEPVELGPSPEATVATRHLDSAHAHEREARGFSFGELTSAGIPVFVAKRERLSLDIRRRSVLDWNVELLRQWFAGTASEPKKVEEPVTVAAVAKKK